MLIVPALLAGNDRYGGDTRVRLHASGNFRVAQMKGRWFLVTPEGHPYFALGANHVNAYFKNEAQASEAAILKSIRKIGFNAGDAYQPVPSYAAQLPWIHPIVNYGVQNPDVFDDSVLKKIHSHVRQAAAMVRDNPWVIGIAGPDLPVWNSKRVDMFREHPRYRQFLRARYSSIEAFNAKHNTAFQAFEEIKAPLESGDDAEFAALIADRLFRTVRDAVREGAPNHLFLGERTYLRSVPPQVLETMARYVDVFCTQAVILSAQRPPEWQSFQADGWDREFAITGKPTVLIDWAAPFSLRETFQSPQGEIRNERDASKDAALFLGNAIERPYLVGVFVCQLIGTHPNDVRFFQDSARRSYLRDDGTAYRYRTGVYSGALRKALTRVYATLK